MRGKKLLVTLGLFLFAGIAAIQTPDMSTVQAAEIAEEKAASTLAETPESDFTWEGTTIVSYDGDDAVVVIPSKATSIGDWAFLQCTTLEKVVIPNSVMTIGEYAFVHCTNLETVALPNSITSIGYGAFGECYSLKEMSIPNTVTNLGGCLFAYCENLETVTLPNSITSIEYGVFGGCYSLKEISIPNTVTSIGESAFVMCESLEEIVIPSNVETIGAFAFVKCTSLQKVFIENVNVKYLTDPEREEYGVFLDSPNVTLYSYAGSTTEQYAKEWDIPFVFYSGWREGADGQLRYYDDKTGKLLTNQFFFDGKFTYYLQADGTMMKDRLTYHPDGEHIIYFDKDGHEVFNAFQYCPSVGYTCYFDSQGYLYKDKITFVGDKAYYLNGNGKMEDSGWFQFANGVDYGYADPDGSLRTNGFSYDPWGRVVFYHWNGMVARGLITDGVWYYLMDYTDGHYLGSFPVA